MQLTGDRIVRSTCGLCGIGCGVLVHIRDQKVAKIEGDPLSPLSKGALCPRGAASLEYLYHPDRPKHPLKRAGGRGEGKWIEISWDDALDEIADNFKKTRDRYGPESVAFAVGMAKGLQDSYISRFANVFGSPNVAWQGHVCFVPRMLSSKLTYGFYAIVDYDSTPGCVIVWGKNMANTLHHAHKRLLSAIGKGTKLIVVDPREIDLTERSDLWLQPRPGTDLALALSMMHVIIGENLFDSNFVENYTVGFEKLRKHVRDYSPERVEQITWIPAEKITAAARMYANTKPACIQWGNALDHGINSFQTARALCILRAITGNLCVPGGDIKPLLVPLSGRRSPELELQDQMPADKLKRRIGEEQVGIPTVRYIHPQSLIKAILEEKPYPIPVAYIQGCNPLLTYTNAKKTYEALMKLEFLAVADVFMTPTAAIADMVLPVGTYLEWDAVVVPMFSYPMASIQQKVTQIGECRSDYEILRGLAVRLGIGDCFREKETECLDEILKPSGLSFDEFRKICVIEGGREYGRYETEGFETPSGKVEIYSERLEEWGLDPLPVYHEPPETPESDPDLASEYPLIISTRKNIYRHSEGRQSPTLRGIRPEPVVDLHPETALKLGIKEGDWVCIETRRGTIKQRAHLTAGVDPRVVGIGYAWWYPEDGITNLYGWTKANVNILTDDKPPYNPELGTSNTKNMVCKVFKAPESK
ncbi:MAG: molybdopterin-dependent oxidoreductase [Deltaproteobacteria bacterium]|nr:molybdopterin-dependent oxidoreductase [Deltaproteobacteria bacterium]